MPGLPHPQSGVVEEMMRDTSSVFVVETEMRETSLVIVVGRNVRDTALVIVVLRNERDFTRDRCGKKSERLYS